MRSRLLVALPLLAGCGPEEPPPVAPPPAPPPAVAPTASSSASSSPGLVGAACKAEHPFSQGDCADGLLCGPGPAGYTATVDEGGKAVSRIFAATRKL